MSKRAAYRVVWILSALAIAGMTYLFASQPFALPVPGAMTSYTAGDHSISLQRPGNWKAQERSLHGVETEVRFEPARNVRMVIVSDLLGSLQADIVKSGNDSLNSLPGMEGIAREKTKTPLETLHAVQAQEMAKNKEEYASFQDGETTRIQVAGYEALVTDFTCEAKGAFSSRPMVGRRITLLAGERRVTLVYCCLKEMRAVLMPTFDAMRASLKLEQPGG